MTTIERLRAVRQLALGSRDYHLAAECESALRRLGVSVDCDPAPGPAVEAAVPPKPRRRK